MQPISDRLILAVFCLGLVVFYCAFAYGNYADGNGVLDAAGHLVGRDFVVFWTASSLTLSEQVSRIFDLGEFHAAQQELVGTPLPLAPWLYPPSALFAVLPLGLLPYLWSYGLWSTATLGLYLIAGTRGAVASLRSLVLVLAPASFVNVVMGQNGFLSAALLIGGMRLLDSRPVLAGVLLGLLSYKPQLGLLVPVALLAGRHWRSFTSAAITVGILIAASVAVFGWESWQAYFATSASYQAKLLHQGSGWTLSIATTPFLATLKLGWSAAAGAVAQLLVLICAALGVYAVFRTPADRSLQIAVLLVGAYLASPYALNYDMTIVSVAAFWSFQHARATGFVSGERLLTATVWLLPLLVVIDSLRDHPVAPLVLAAYFALLLARTKGWLRGPRPTAARRDVDLEALRRSPEGRAS